MIGEEDRDSDFIDTPPPRKRKPVEKFVAGGLRASKGTGRRWQKRRVRKKSGRRGSKATEATVRLRVRCRCASLASRMTHLEDKVGLHVM